MFLQHQCEYASLSTSVCPKNYISKSDHTSPDPKFYFIRSLSKSTVHPSPRHFESIYRLHNKKIFFILKILGQFYVTNLCSSTRFGGLRDRILARGGINSTFFFSSGRAKSVYISFVICSTTKASSSSSFRTLTRWWCKMAAIWYETILIISLPYKVYNIHDKKIKQWWCVGPITNKPPKQDVIERNRHHIRRRKEHRVSVPACMKTSPSLSTTLTVAFMWGTGNCLTEWYRQ